MRRDNGPSRLIAKIIAGEKLSLTNEDARYCVKRTFELIKEMALKGRIVQIRGFGSFRYKRFKARKRGLPGRIVVVPAHKKLIMFTKEMILEKQSHAESDSN